MPDLLRLLSHLPVCLVKLVHWWPLACERCLAASLISKHNEPCRWEHKRFTQSCIFFAYTSYFYLTDKTNDLDLSALASNMTLLVLSLLPLCVKPRFEAMLACWRHSYNSSPNNITRVLQRDFEHLIYYDCSFTNRFMWIVKVWLYLDLVPQNHSFLFT